MTTDFRALCAELHEALEKRCETLEEDRLLDRSAAALRTALAQPEPEPPADEALANFSGWFCRNYPGPDTIIYKPEWHAPKVFRAAADAIARYARPTIEPVPVSERLPGPEDCDRYGQCWFWCKAVKTWDFRSRNRQMVHDTHWLPANALPTPEATNA